MSKEEDDDFGVIDRLEEALSSLVSENIVSNDDIYPKEALPIGTVVRSKNHDRLGAVYDAFYGDIDKNNTKIIVYTVLLFPEVSIRYKKLDSNTYYLTNEYEYDIIAFLMMPCINMDSLSKSISLGTKQ